VNLGLHAFVDIDVLAGAESIDVDHVCFVDVPVVSPNYKFGLERHCGVGLQEALRHLLEPGYARDQILQFGSVAAFELD
jgi:hypothetical protein